MTKKFDNICKRLKVTEGASDSVKALICKTILTLPAKHRERVLDEVIFIDIDDVHGQYERYKPSRPAFLKREAIHFIVLSLSMIPNEEERMYVIAHEIAHYILGHYELNIETDQDIETEADTVAIEWGFIMPDRRKEMY